MGISQKDYIGGGKGAWLYVIWFIFLKMVCLFILESERVWWEGQRVREKEKFQAETPLSAEPYPGLGSMTLGS